MRGKAATKAARSATKKKEGARLPLKKTGTAGRNLSGKGRGTVTPIPHSTGRGGDKIAMKSVSTSSLKYVLKTTLNVKNVEPYGSSTYRVRRQEDFFIVTSQLKEVCGHSAPCGANVRQQLSLSD